MHNNNMSIRKTFIFGTIIFSLPIIGMDEKLEDKKTDDFIKAVNNFLTEKSAAEITDKNKIEDKKENNSAQDLNNLLAMKLSINEKYQNERFNAIENKLNTVKDKFDNFENKLDNIKYYVDKLLSAFQKIMCDIEDSSSFDFQDKKKPSYSSPHLNPLNSIEESDEAKEDKIDDTVGGSIYNKGLSDGVKLQYNKDKKGKKK